jgi:hypothetical protein
MLAQLRYLISAIKLFFTGKKKKPIRVTAKATAYVTNNETVKLTLDGVLLAVK